MMGRVLSRFTCINICNKLEEFNLISRKRMNIILAKRDKQEKEFNKKGDK